MAERSVFDQLAKNRPASQFLAERSVFDQLAKNRPASQFLTSESKIKKIDQLARIGRVVNSRGFLVGPGAGGAPRRGAGLPFKATHLFSDLHPTSHFSFSKLSVYHQLTIYIILHTINIVKSFL